LDTSPRNTRAYFGVDTNEEAEEEVEMLAVIGNLIAGLGVLSLFTATLRLQNPRRPA
jgi:hypothetical protein